jgi:hypothetical protein
VSTILHVRRYGLPFFTRRGWVVIAAGGFAGGFICGVIACMGM